MVKKIFWAILELITLAGGTGIFVAGALARYSDEEMAGLGAVTVVVGLLVRDWRKTIFFKQPTSTIVNDRKETLPPNKDIIIGIVLITSFTLWSHNFQKINRASNDINSLEYEVRKMKY